jgi:hypothetical protein
MSAREQLLIKAEMEAAALTQAMQDVATEAASAACQAVVAEGERFVWREGFFNLRDGRRLRLSVLVEEVDDEP